MPSATQMPTILFRGGLNLGASVFEMQAGEATQLFNYEVNTLGRYQRILGYERFDGRPSPSAVVPSELQGFPFDNDEDEASAVLNERNSRRNAIGPVEGSGPIRGVVNYNGAVYVFRDDVDGTRCVMHKSSPTGWVEVTTPALTAGGRYEFVVANFKLSLIHI